MFGLSKVGNLVIHSYINFTKAVTLLRAVAAHRQYHLWAEGCCSPSPVSSVSQSSFHCFLPFFPWLFFLAYIWVWRRTAIWISLCVEVPCFVLSCLQRFPMVINFVKNFHQKSTKSLHVCIMTFKMHLCSFTRIWLEKSYICWISSLE